MKKTIIRELAFYMALFAILAFGLHPERISMINASNWWHPFVYSFGVYCVIGVFRLLFAWVVRMIMRFRKIQS